MKWLLIIAAIVIAIPLTLAAVGAFLPQNHVASRTIAIAAPPERVFAAISDVDRFTAWRSGLKSVEKLPDDGKGARFIERSGNGDILFRIETLEPNTRMVARIADPKLPFGGSWTYVITPSAGGSELTITEAGEVYNVFFRSMQKLFFSPYKTIDTYQADLKKLLEAR
jgi:uncharacterized protein YndB with AHSA1/START domain